MQPTRRRDAKLRGVLPVFVYGTLRTDSWNHDRWLAPWLSGPCRSAVLPGYALHHHRGLPYVVATPGREVVGELAVLQPERYDAGLDCLDGLEDVEHRHYDRVRAEVRLDGEAGEAGEMAWVWVAGPSVAASLAPATLVAAGDFLTVERA
jgi:gamma-glutamylcyclotransferase (GGCT)/AIG2-like uncharacterized protein YtfP